LDELTNKWKVNCYFYCKGSFPKHCVENTFGAEFHKDLDTSRATLTVKKGTEVLKESFSGHGNPDLSNYLQNNIIKRAYVCGLAYDFCVGHTALDTAKLGIETFVIYDASRLISDETTKTMEELFTSNNVKIIMSLDIN